MDRREAGDPVVTSDEVLVAISFTTERDDEGHRCSTDPAEQGAWQTNIVGEWDKVAEIGKNCDDEDIEDNHAFPVTEVAGHRTIPRYPVFELGDGSFEDVGGLDRPPHLDPRYT